MPRERVTDWLRDATVVLLATPPDRDDNDDENASDTALIAADDAAAAVDEAVIALSRAVFAEAGTIAVRADSGFSALVAHLAAEYWDAAPIENESGPARRSPPVLLYGADSPVARTLSRLPYVAVRSADAVQPAAVVLIGCTAEEAGEVSFWRERTRSRLFFPIRASGGLAAGHENPAEQDLVRLLHSRRLELRPSRESEHSRETGGEEPLGRRAEDEWQFPFSHYPLLMRSHVSQIIAWWQENRPRKASVPAPEEAPSAGGLTLGRHIIAVKAL